MIEKSCSITRDCAKGVLVVNFFLFFASYSWLTQVWCVGTMVDGRDARRRSSGVCGDAPIDHRRWECTAALPFFPIDRFFEGILLAFRSKIVNILIYLNKK